MAKKPILILVSGAPATGKTTLAKKLSNHLKVPYFSVDEIKEIVSEKIAGRENKELYDKVLNASYDIFYKSLEKILSTNGICIAEALFIKDFAKNRIKKLKNKINFRIIQIYLKADEKIANKRYDMRHKCGRRHKSHVPKMSMVLKKYGGYEKLLKKAKLNISETIEVNTNNFKNVNFKKIINQIGF